MLLLGRDVLLIVAYLFVGDINFIANAASTGVNFFLVKLFLFYAQAVEVAGLNDDHGNQNFELALARNSWRVRVHKTLESSQKPLIQQIETFIKEVAAFFYYLEFYSTLVKMDCTIEHALVMLGV